VIFSENGHTRQGWLYHYRAKWKVTRDSAEMPDECIAAIRDFHQAAGRDFDTMPPDEPIFPGVAGPALRHQPMNLANVGKRFRLYARAAGIADTIVTHSLRHENAWTRYQLNGFDILDVRDALGHKNISMTMTYIEKRKRRQHGDPIASVIAGKFARR
jgi:integrase